MKFTALFRFELTYQLKRLSTWLHFLVLLILTLLLSLSFTDNARTGKALMDAPIVIAAITAFASAFALFMIAAITGDALMRDSHARMDPLVYTSSVKKMVLFSSRLLVSFLIAIVSVTMAVLSSLATIKIMAPELFGSTGAGAYLQALLLFIIPNVLMGILLLAAFVLFNRSAMAGFIAAIMLFFCLIIGMDLLTALNKWNLAQLVDFSGFTVLKAVRLRWTDSMLSVESVPFDQFLILNRLLWISAASVLFMVSSIRFRFTHTSSPRALRKRINIIEETSPHSPSLKILNSAKAFNVQLDVRQALCIGIRSFREIIWSWKGILILVMCGLLFHVLSELLEGPLGVPLVPVTGNMIKLLSHQTLEMIIAGLLTLQIGQLIWRERDARIQDLTDTLPVRDSVQLAGKFLAFILLVLSFQAALMLTGIAIQESLDYHQYDIAVYARALFGFQLVDYLLLGVAAFFIHTLVNNKYTGLLLVLLFYAYMILPSVFKIEHNLLVYGSDPGITYTDMNGFKPDVGPWLWFKLLWVLIGIVLLIVSHLLWVRGHRLFRERFAGAKQRLFGKVSIMLTVLLLFALATGSWIFYNTNILNEYETVEKAQLNQVQYEKRYKRYSGILQPEITEINIEAELFPYDNSVDIKGYYILINNTTSSIDSLHIAPSPENKTSLSFDVGVQQVLVDDMLGYSVFALNDPLLPGDSLIMHFALSRSANGFTNTGLSHNVMENGTYFIHSDLLPAIGYQPDRELKSQEARMKYSLALRLPVHSLYDSVAIQNSTRDLVRFAATIGTSADQVALTTGTLVKTWTKNGRSYFQYASQKPVRADFPITSAAYALYEKKWKGITLQIFYHPQHTQNLKRMMKSLEKSLEYHTVHYGPYPLDELKLVEYAGSGALTSFPGMITFPESFALMNPERDYRAFDLPFAAIAHEVAHQWWGNQLIPAQVEGAALLTESLAWYSAMGVVNDTFGDTHLNNLLSVMHESYLTPRSKADVPLIRSYDRFLRYRKGPFAMHTLRKYIGEERVNDALQQLMKKYAQVGSTLPVSLDLYHELDQVTPDSLTLLLHDLFIENTYWDIKTNSVTPDSLPDGSWQVIIQYSVTKIKVDSAGIETSLPVNDYLEVGVFSDDLNEPVLYRKMHRVQSGEQTITVQVNRKPSYAGVDSYALMIDVNAADNTKPVEFQDHTAAIKQ